MTNEGDIIPPVASPASLGVRGLCPRCEKGHLFEGYLRLAPRCDVCHLDYEFADPADGPAFFAMMIATGPVLLFAVWFQATFDLSYWWQIPTTLPLAAVLCLALLRPLKGWLVCSQYVHKAQEGSIDRDFHSQAKQRFDNPNSSNEE